MDYKDHKHNKKIDDLIVWPWSYWELETELIHIPLYGMQLI